MNGTGAGSYILRQEFELNLQNRFVNRVAFALRAGARCRSSPRKCHEKTVLLLLAASLAWTGLASAEERAIDARTSVITVRVYKAGLFSALGHDHEIVAPIGSGTVNTARPQGQVHIHANSLRVRDLEASEKDRNEIQKTMLGPEVLDVAHYPEIVFQSTRAEPAGTDSWRVHGNLTLHGQTHPVIVEVRNNGGHYTGASRFKQTTFGIKPIKVAGGTVRVKDEIRIEFDIQMPR